EPDSLPECLDSADRERGRISPGRGTVMTPDPSPSRFTSTSSAFSMSCAVQINIRANAEIVWSLLTDATGFPRWNSTVRGIEGQIREGERLRLHVPGTSRTFTPKVSGVVAARRMTWSDGFNPIFKGVRTFELNPG